jgi:uncharacterized protein YlxW (UPF0749 family)
MMQILVIPSPARLNMAPELGLFAVLLTAIEVAAVTLKAEHPRLENSGSIILHKSLTASEKRATQLLSRLTELTRVIHLYRAAIDDAIGPIEGADLPF